MGMPRPLAGAFCLGLIMAAMAPRVKAQGLPDGFAQASVCGPLTAISDKALEVHGLKVRLIADTLLKGVNDGGRVVELKPADLSAGCVATVFLENQGSAPVALAIYRGDAFLVRGTVSDLKTGKDGYVNAITVDRCFEVDVRDAEAGQESDQNPSGGGQQPDDTVDVGDEIILQGIAVGGAYHAVFVRIMTGSDGDEGEPEGTPLEVRRHPSGRQSLAAPPRMADRCHKPTRNRASGVRPDKPGIHRSRARLPFNRKAPSGPQPPA